jgi:hypothetical protein
MPLDSSPCLRVSVADLDDRNAVPKAGIVSAAFVRLLPIAAGSREPMEALRCVVRRPRHDWSWSLSC